MVYSGNSLALSARDKIVNNSVHEDKASINYQKGNNLSAALYDFAGIFLLVQCRRLL